MRFYVVLALVNVACFLPLYLLNVRTAANPFRLLPIADGSGWKGLVKLCYARESTDPFRIHFDFTFVVLLAAAAGATGPIVTALAAVLLAFGFLEILYTSVMHSIFRRPPALTSDLTLLRIGASFARRQLWWMASLVGLGLILIWLASVAVVSALFDQQSPSRLLALATAGLLVPPCVYHGTRHYGNYVGRSVYSPALHLLLNLRFVRLVRRLADRDVAYYQGLNGFGRVRLEAPPNVVIVCVESYGSVVYRDARSGVGIDTLLAGHEREMARAGYKFASTFSEAPLFAGGSWLSYASFAYGTAIDNVQLYDALFSRAGNFGAYESLFHVLRRNGYKNVLLCPLGGVDARAVDWDSVDRCFQPHVRVGFDDLGYLGPTVNFFGSVRLHSALDQFALNFGYERALGVGEPFSLFFCTLNSHYPWSSSGKATDDWRALNVPAVEGETESSRHTIDRYNEAIRYQLDYIFRFAVDRAAHAPLIILFGDHQPPTITPVQMGKETPVHVVSKDQTLIDVFLSHGFAPRLDLTGERPRLIRHEGSLSLLMKAMQAAYGAEPGLDVPYRQRGAMVFEDEAAGMS